jgi:hypothetical protein
MAQNQNISEKRVPYPLYNNFRSFIVDELDKRKNAFPNPVVTPFLRMTACTQDQEVGRRFFTLGLHGFNDADYDMFDSAYGSMRDIVGYSYDINSNGKKRLHSSDMLSADSTPPDLKEMNQKEQGIANIQRQNFQEGQSRIFSNTAHPIPGILSATVDRTSPFSPFIATVEWQCYNRPQLEFLRHHFMSIGQYVVLEWGNQFYDRQPKKILDFSDANIVHKLAECIRKGRSYIINEYVSQNNGNYDFVVGVVQQFNVTVDSKTGIYTCTTRICSPGETIFGINNNFTFIDSSTVTNSGTQPITTIVDFFKPSMKFDELVNQHSKNSKLVANYSAKLDRDTKNVNKSTTDLAGDFYSSPHDYRFVSWEFFADKLIPEIFKLIKADVTMNLNDWFDISYTKQADNPLSEETWVGYNEHLKSTEPNTMILITKDMKTVVAGFDNIGRFGAEPNSGGYRGKLSSGVWLNTAMIRNCFLEETNLISSLKRLLIQLNNATQGYWQLALVWDDEIGKWRIIDKAISPKQPSEHYYRFNKINSDGSVAFDTLDIDLESAFPPELVTQTTMYSRYRTATPERRAELFRKYNIGSPSTFVFSLNWTGLVDLLAQELEVKNEDATDTTVKGSTPGKEPETNRARVVSSGGSITTGPVTATAGGGSQAGSKIGNNVVTNPKNFDGTASTNLKVGSHIGAIPRSVQLAPDGLPDDLMRNGEGSGIGAYALNTTRLTHPAFLKSYTEWKATAEERVKGLRIGIASATRNPAYQANLRVKRGNQAAKPGTSKHQTGQAIDFEVSIDGIPLAMNDPNNYWLWQTLNQCAEDVNRTSGGKPGYAKLKMLDKDLERHHIEMDGDRTPPVPDEAFEQVGTYEEFYSGKIPEPKGDKIFWVIPKKQKNESDVDAGSLPTRELAVAERVSGISERFGDTIIPMVELDASAMIARLTKSGYDNPKTPNNYTTGFPTTTALTVTTVGIAGISISDVFTVDRLPYIFNQYGAFQVTGLTETISPSGWITKIKGYFKLMWLEGRV